MFNLKNYFIDHCRRTADFRSQPNMSQLISPRSFPKLRKKFCKSILHILIKVLSYSFTSQNVSTYIKGQFQWIFRTLHNVAFSPHIRNVLQSARAAQINASFIFFSSELKANFLTLFLKRLEIKKFALFYILMTSWKVFK